MKCKNVPKKFLIYSGAYFCISVLFLLSLHITFLLHVHAELLSFLYHVNLLICFVSPIKFLMFVFFLCFMIVMITGFSGKYNKRSPIIYFIIAAILLFLSNLWIAFNLIYGSEVVPFFCFFILGWGILLGMCDKSPISWILVILISIAVFYSSLFYMYRVNEMGNLYSYLQVLNSFSVGSVFGSKVLFRF